MKIEENISKNLLSKINNIEMESVLAQIREIIQTAISFNFEQGGRFGNGKLGGGRQKWKPSQRAIRQRGQTLLDTVVLANSIRVDVKKERGNIIIELGSNKPYARIHNLGGTIRRNTKNGTTSIKMPARPFLVIQNTDIEQINKIVCKYIVSKL